MAFAARPTSVRVWAGITETRPCKFCRHTIVWRTRMDTGKTLPFDLGATVREEGRDVRHNLYHLLAFADVHNCPKRPPKAKLPAPRLF